MAIELKKTFLALVFLGVSPLSMSIGSPGSPRWSNWAGGANLRNIMTYSIGKNAFERVAAAAAFTALLALKFGLDYYLSGVQAARYPRE